MPKTRPPYPPEFRRRLLDLVRAGRTPESLSKEFKVSARSIRTSASAAHSATGGRGGGPPSPLRAPKPRRAWRARRGGRTRSRRTERSTGAFRDSRKRSPSTTPADAGG